METDNLFAKMTDFHTTYCMLMEGCKGYDNMSDEETEEQYITYFGDSIKKEVEFNFN